MHQILTKIVKYQFTPLINPECTFDRKIKYPRYTFQARFLFMAASSPHRNISKAIYSQLAIMAAYAIFLFGCTKEPELTISIAPETPAAIKTTVEDVWPKIKTICPGLIRYSSDIQFAGIENNLSYAPENAKRIEIKFRVSENPTKIPDSYRAAGHMCFFSLSPDGKELNISKSSCASLCTDTEETNEYSKAL